LAGQARPVHGHLIVNKTALESTNLWLAYCNFPYFTIFPIFTHPKAQTNQMLHYTYTATGQKISQQLEDDGRMGTYREYAGPFVYVNQELGWVNTPHGRIYNLDLGNQGSQKEYILEFHLRDHTSTSLSTGLGNTRLVLEKHQDEYIPTQQAFYYPFGMAIAGLSQQLPESGQGRLFENRYLYNGKEYQDDFGLNWYDYGARFYDAQIARFHTLDPLSEKYSFQSPFAYAANNPILFIDFMGLGPGLTGPFTGRVYTNSRGGVNVYRITTSQRQVLKASEQVVYAMGYAGGNRRCNKCGRVICE
jgi:RHS repeat-associated protein